jgi:hypothetical protein
MTAICRLKNGITIEYYEEEICFVRGSAMGYTVYGAGNTQCGF